MKRPRTDAPGPDRPSRHRSPSSPGFLLPFVAALALIAAACGNAAGTVAPNGSGAAGSTAAASGTSGATGAESPSPATEAPTEASATDGPATDTPTDTPTEAPSPSTDASASAATDPAGDCTGTAGNRTFYGSVAAAVDWTVYCPVLPSGWFVESGQYRLAGGGRLVITYRGPAGAHFTLDEGAWCTDGSGCTPSGSDMGSAAFGDREGSLIATDNGNFDIAVDAGSPISWLLAGDGLDEATVRAFGAALIVVGG